MDIFQVRERNSPSEGVVGHTDVGDAIRSEYVEDVAILREAEPGVGLRRKLLKNAAGDGAGVAGDGAELRQDDGASGHQSVEDRHRQKIRENVLCL